MKKELKSFNGMTEYMLEKPFKKMLYTVWNYLSDEGYITFLQNCGYSSDIESLEYLQIKTDDNEKELIKKGKSVIANGFCHYINDELQPIRPIIHAMTLKEYGVVIVSKPKVVSITNLLTE